MITSRLFFMWNYSGPCSSSVFVLGDAVASVGRLAFSFTDRRNSSLCKKLYVTFPSDTTGRSFRKSKTTLARAPIAGKVSKFSDLQGKAVLFGRVGNLVRSPL